MTEVDVYYEEHESYRHCLAAWRRERAPERPRERPIRLVPDWVCEILSPTNAANDMVRKQRILHKHRVSHYWLLDPVEGTLRVLRWTPEGYLEALGAKADETVRAEPFDAVEIPLSVVLGLE
jgi:Uma2 family endonuclease